MTERPILFTADMVRAILDGRKFQTRRIVKPFPWLLNGRWELREGLWYPVTPSGKTAFGPVPKGDLFSPARCPYGQVGDLLWVREAWRTGSKLDDMSPIEIEHAADDAGYERGPRCPLCYEADRKVRHWGDNDLGNFGDWGRYRHARFMPRWASRLTLRVTDIRVERVQDMSEADAVAEGLTRLSKDGHLYKWGIPDADGLPGNDDHGWHWAQWEVDPRKAYARLWDSINGKKRGCSWADNPWVFVLGFERVEVTR